MAATNSTPVLEVEEITVEATTPADALFQGTVVVVPEAEEAAAPEPR